MAPKPTVFFTVAHETVGVRRYFLFFARMCAFSMKRSCDNNVVASSDSKRLHNDHNNNKNKEEEDCVFERSLSPLPKTKRRTPSRCRSVQWNTPITDRNINILFDWTLEVVDYYKQSVDTAEVSFRLLRLFLINASSVSMRHYQLAAAVAIWIASKMCGHYEAEELRVEELVYVCNQTYTRKDFISMERHMLTVLNYEIPKPLVVDSLIERGNFKEDSHELKLCSWIILASLVKRDFTFDFLSKVVSKVKRDKPDREVMNVVVAHNLPHLAKLFPGVDISMVCPLTSSSSLS